MIAQRRWRAWPWLGLLVASVVGLAILRVAGVMLTAYWADPALLWRDFYHDRNSHFLNGLNLALDLAALDPAGFVAHATADPVWPPLHAIVLAVVLLVGGMDHRLAILPSLFGWTATVGLCGLLGARLTPAGVPGWFTGAVAALLALASPGFRLLGSDVMLEGLGAALGAGALLAFTWHPAGAPARGTPSRAMLLTALLLTALFLEKYNYWLLILGALAVSLALDDGPALAAAMRRSRPAMWLRRLVVSVPGLAGLAILLAAAGLAATGPRPISLLGRDFVVFPALPLTLGYGLLLLRASYLWRTARGAAHPALGVLVRWHLIPVALWLLVPQALGRFVWFIGPTHGGASLGYDPWQAVLLQWDGFAQGFHGLLLGVPVPGILVAALALLGGAGLLARPRLRCVALFAALSSVVLVLHPQQQWRFQATMLFAVWVCAAVGAGLVLAGAVRIARCGITGPALAGVLAAGALAGWSPAAPLAERVAIRTPRAPSDLALAAVWQKLLRDAGAVGVVTSFGPSDLFAWSLREACRCRVAIDQAWLRPAASPAEAALLLDEWLARVAVDYVLFVDVPPPYPVPGQKPVLGGLGAVLQGAPRLVPVLASPELLGDARVMLWKVAAPPSHPAPPRRRLDAILSLSLALIVGAILLWPARRTRT